MAELPHIATGDARPVPDVAPAGQVPDPVSGAITGAVQVPGLGVARRIVPV